MFDANPLSLFYHLAAVALIGWLVFRRGFRKAKPALADSDFERIAVSSAQDGLVVEDERGVILWVNKAYCDIIGYAAHEVIGRNPLSFAVPKDMRPSEEEIASFRHDPNNEIFQRFNVSKLHLVRNQRKNGELFWMQISVSLHKGSSGQNQFVNVCRDVTEQIEGEMALKKASKALEKVALQDPLTGIPNRRGLFEFVDSFAKQETGLSNQIGLLHIDLDRFKEINDNHGHAAGDAILHHVATQARDTLRATDIVARIGGDEFAAICTGLDTEEHLKTVANALAAAIEKPMNWKGRTLSVGASVGAILSSTKNLNINELLKRSDHALYAVKSSGRGQVQIYDQAFGESFERETLRINELSVAVANDQITHRFLPVMRIDTGEITGFEILSRWDHPRLGMLKARSFLKDAETLGCLDQIDLLAVKAGAKALRSIHAMGYTSTRVAINVSSAFLGQRDIAKTLSKIAQAEGLLTKSIILEVPEAIIVTNSRSDDRAANIRALKDAGFVLIADHFSARFLGLTHLDTLPIDGLKVSRSLTSELETDKIQQKVLATILDIAKDLGLTTVIQGVETAERARLLSDNVGQRVQGHWVAAPLEANELGAWIEKHYDKFLHVSDVAPGQEPRYLRANS